MKIFHLFNIAGGALLRNKTRALLTMLGIIIGIASVIAMVSLGQSSTVSINDQISEMGSNLIIVMPSAQRKGGVNVGAAASKKLEVKDVEALSKYSNYISAISPSVNAGGQLINGVNNWRGIVQGGDVDFFEIRKYNLKNGIFFNDFDVKTAAKVCVIGQTVADNLFPYGELPVGKTIRFNKIPLKVIGVLESKGQNSMGQDQDDVVIAPYTTVQKRILAITHINVIFASAKNEDVANLAAEEVKVILRANHKLKLGEEDDFRVHTQKEILDIMGSVTGMLTILLAAIASISLVVGGIGIMNIMYVSVTERTKEIGLRMSIGAQNNDILMQFLAESIILSIIGGVVGIILGTIIAYIASYLLDWPFVVSTVAIIVSFFVCAATGIFFGWYPAKKASNLDPINALRYE